MTKEKSETLKAGRNLSSTIETNIQNEDVSPGLGGESVRRGNIESSVGSEKRTYFDIYFDARLPGSNTKRIYLLKIDLEIQKSLNLNYPIENRALYYLAREVSSQLDYVYEDNTAYADLNKAFTIWLCLNDIPKHLQNTIIKHKMMVSEAYGIEKEETPKVDLMEMVIIRLGGRPDMEKEPGIRKELISMSGIAALNFREGQMEGRMEGRKEGRIISLYYDADLSVEEIAEKTNCAISDVEAVLDNMDATEIWNKKGK